MSHPAGGACVETRAWRRIAGNHVVAPRRGACVETKLLAQLLALSVVAPRRGACVETALQQHALAQLSVAPHRGACVETTKRSSLMLLGTSHPTGVRVLKSQWGDGYRQNHKSSS